MFIWRCSFLLVLRLHLTLAFKIRGYVSNYTSSRKTYFLHLEEKGKKNFSWDSRPTWIGPSSQIRQRQNCVIWTWFLLHNSFILFCISELIWISFAIHTSDWQNKIVWFYFHLSMKILQIFKTRIHAIHISIKEITYMFSWCKH